MKITICCVGKIKERFYKDAIDEYKKRLSKYVKLEILEAEDEKTPDRVSEAEKQKILEKEGKRLLSFIKKDAYVIALDIKGNMLDSDALSKMIENTGTYGCSHIQFLIGGSLGLHKSVLDASDYRLSFSSMTFPHQLMRVILLEQIYRSYRIINKEPYHK